MSRKSGSIFSLLFLLSMTIAFSQDLGEIMLRDLDGKVAKLSSFKPTLRAVVFLSPECPLSRNYSLVLNQLQERNSKIVTVIGVFPGTSYHAKDYLEFREKYKIQFPLLTDSAKRLVAKLNAKVTPEVFLLDADGNIVYSGAIDNWVIDLDKKRNKPTVHYLSDAIFAFVQGMPVRQARTQAVGCYISDL